MAHRSIYVGWDPREAEAYDVCEFAIRRHASEQVAVEALRLDELRQRGLYWRAEDATASTEFTYSRFLVPHLMDYSGWALFLDCDFLITADIAEVFGLADERYAVLCVHHDHRPTETTKMDGVQQTVYPRKNWSSFVLWNCGHPANRQLTPQIANSETGAFLHRFQWLDDELIGEIPVDWNWLEGWNEPFEGRPPKGIHFTRGGPWFENYQDVEYADLWRLERSRLAKAVG